MERASAVIKDILLECLVQNANQPIDGVDSNACIRYMNRFMATMSAYGASLGYTNISSPSDYVTIEDGGKEGLIFNTALRLCTSYGIEPSQVLVANARDGKSAMFLLSKTQNKTQHPSTLPIGSGNERFSTDGSFDKFYQPTDSVQQEQYGTILLESGTNEQED